MATFVGNKIICFFEEIFRVVRPILRHFFQIMDEGKITRRVALWSSIIITIYAIQWCFGFANVPPPGFTGVDVGAVIGAVMTPVSLLTAALMKFNSDGHSAAAALEAASAQIQRQTVAIEAQVPAARNKVAANTPAQKSLKDIEEEMDNEVG